MADLVVWKRLAAMVRKHEGHSPELYIDTTGHITGGVGRNFGKLVLNPDGTFKLIPEGTLPKQVINYMFREDMATAYKVARQFMGDTWDSLNGVRQEVLINMAFNLGYRLNGFTKMRRAIVKQSFGVAAAEMLDSVWYTQVGKRAEELARAMERGDWRERSSGSDSEAHS